MKTRFQISMQRESPLLTNAPLVFPAGVKSTCNSEHGPHGPVSPIIQKLSFLLPLTMWTAGSSPTRRNFSAQKSHASWSKSLGSFLLLSGEYTVAYNRCGGNFQISTTSSQAHSIASLLK